MDFKKKALMIRFMESIPYGDNLYYFLQKSITKSLVMNNDLFIDAVSRKILLHLNSIKEYGKTKLSDACFYEFGAGWDLLAPIGFSIMSGVKKYICVDLNRFMHPEDVLETIKFYLLNKEELKKKLTETDSEDLCSSNRWNTMTIDSLPNPIDTQLFLKNTLYIDYLAPCDARNTSFESSSIDYIIANTTLQHIPEDDAERIIRECMRVCKKDGLLSVTISYIDHYANTDNTINYYNFLKYSDEAWKKYNPMHHYQNRLRHSDWEKLFIRAGCKIVDEESYIVKPEYYDMLESVKLDERWRGYSKEDLVKTGAHFVLGRADR